METFKIVEIEIEIGEIRRKSIYEGVESGNHIVNVP